MNSKHTRLLERHRRLIGTAGVLVASCLAIVYFFVVPDEASQRTGGIQLILRYGHSLCWGLLAGSSLSWSKKATKIAKILGLTALICYAVFILTLIASS